MVNVCMKKDDFPIFKFKQEDDFAIFKFKKEDDFKLKQEDDCHFQVQAGR